MAALPLSWAVRQELQDKSYRESALYFQQLVGLGGVQRIALVSREGSIRVATTRSSRVEPRPKRFRAPRSTRTARRSAQSERKVSKRSCQIMGLNTRLGTLIDRLRSREGRSATHASPAARHLTRAVRKRGHASCTSGASLPIGTKDQKRLRNDPRRSSNRGFVTATKCLRVRQDSRRCVVTPERRRRLDPRDELGLAGFLDHVTYDNVGRALSERRVKPGLQLFMRPGRASHVPRRVRRTCRGTTDTGLAAVFGIADKNFYTGLTRDWNFIARNLAAVLCAGDDGRRSRPCIAQDHRARCTTRT